MTSANDKKFKMDALVKPISVCYSTYVPSKLLAKGLVDPIEMYIYMYICKRTYRPVESMDSIKLYAYV